MEQAKGYKKAVATIQALEKQLALCDDALNGRGQAALEKEVEEHFAMCMNALAARKEALLREVAQKLAQQISNVEETRKNLVSTIVANKQMLQTSSSIYAINKLAVETIWQGITLTPIPAEESRVSLELSQDLLALIRTHGKVFNRQSFKTPPNDFSVVESVTTIAGSVKGYADGSGTTALLQHSTGMCFNPLDECLYVCDCYNNAIRRITLHGDVSTFVKNGLCYPNQIALYLKEKTFYVSNVQGHTISQITANGHISTFAGDGQSGYKDEIGTAAKFSSPTGITVDQQSGMVFVAEFDNRLIRKITQQGVVSTLACGFEKSELRTIYFDANSNSLLVCGNTLQRVQLDGNKSTIWIGKPATVTMVGNSIYVGSVNGEVLEIVQKGQNTRLLFLQELESVAIKMENHPCVSLAVFLGW